MQGLFRRFISGLVQVYEVSTCSETPNLTINEEAGQLGEERQEEMNENTINSEGTTIQGSDEARNEDVPPLEETQSEEHQDMFRTKPKVNFKKC